MYGKVITMHLVGGTPDGCVACELSNWTGKAYRIPRHLLKTFGGDGELHRPGVYFLFGRDEATKELAVAYVGEAEEIYPRLHQHQDKEFWSEALVFVSKDENLNKAHIKFLENTIHSTAVLAGRFRFENGNTPPRPAISKAEMAVMSEFFDQLRILTGALGYKVFEPLVTPQTQISVSNSTPSQPVPLLSQTSGGTQFSIKGARGADARATITSEGIVVLENSYAAQDEVESTPDSTRKLRKKLLDDGALIVQDSRFRFSRNVLFATPSSAASVVLGRSANGRIEMVNESGRTLKVLEESAVVL